jgi:branched-chain amino acid transport system permease protein
MANLIHLFLNGLSLGCIYVLCSMGFVVVFKTGRIINLAHGQFMAMASLIFILLFTFSGISLYNAFLLTILSCIIIIFIFERLFIHRLPVDDSPRRIFMILGIILMIKGLMSSVLVSGFFADKVGAFELISKTQNTAADSSTSLTILILGIIFILSFLLFLRYSSFGLYIRAISDNRNAALSLGIPIERLHTFSWLIAGLLAAISGILITLGSRFNLDGFGAMESIIFPVIILGGLGSIRGVILGGLLMGLLEVFSGENSLYSFRDFLPYLILLLLLIIRPYGLFLAKGDLKDISTDKDYHNRRMA